jgi:hypothetical protein
MSTLRDSALAYAKRGLHVLPCRPRDKEPATYHGLKDATTDANVIAGWWRGNPDFNIGVLTGKESGIFVVDLDSVDAESELKKLERQHGTLPATVESITAKGRHLFFAWPELTIRNSVGAKGGIAPGIDIRGANGYVVVPPSIHPSGRRYRWSVDSAGVFAAAPQWLLDLIAPRRGRTERNGHALPPSAWAEMLEGTVTEGARNATLTSITGHLLHRLDCREVLALMQAWNAIHCLPPLPEREITRIVNSIAGREYRRRRCHGRG